MGKIKELTERQRRVLRTIEEWIGEHGYPPTIRELGQRLGIRSLRGVTTHLDAIVRKGFLIRKRAARGLRVLIGASPSSARALAVPILGRIAAGQPLLAEQAITGHLAVDGLWLGGEDPARHFALQVRGSSMTNAGILDGDYVIVRQQPDADNGEIVAALVGEEATVKRLFKEGDRIRLQPEHPAMEPLVIEAGQPLAILGKVVAVFRKLS
ncbi:MAG: transcriptional repressor LexA [Candidatus Omnitrophica bacterium]|nr:transcriptional repressor LexA [Candidatus Omnitrophota bacterium]